MQTYKRINEDYLDKTDIDQESVSVLDDVRAELDEWIRDKNSAPLSFNPNVLPDHFYHVESKKHLSQIIRRMKRDYKMGGSLNWLDVTAITNMSFLFGRSIFNFDISRWDVSRVTDMDSMFLDCTFNGNISGWDVSRVENMAFMFCHSPFDNDISGWDVSSVTNYEGIFDDSSLRPEYRPHFNPRFAPRLTEDYLDNLSKHEIVDDSLSMRIDDNVRMLLNSETPNIDFNHLEDAVYKVTDREDLLELIEACMDLYGPDCNLNWIDVSGVREMHGLFADTEFNGDISRWDVSNVRNMNSMFCTPYFNSDISSWNVSNVRDMSCMFCGNTVFDGNLSKWDTHNVREMSYMFSAAFNFDCDLSGWDVSNVRHM